MSDRCRLLPVDVLLRVIDALPLENANKDETILSKYGDSRVAWSQEIDYFVSHPVTRPTSIGALLVVMGRDTETIRVVVRTLLTSASTRWVDAAWAITSRLDGGTVEMLLDRDITDLLNCGCGDRACTHKVRVQRALHAAVCKRDMTSVHRILRATGHRHVKTNLKTMYEFAIDCAYKFDVHVLLDEALDEAFLGADDGFKEYVLEHVICQKTTSPVSTGTLQKAARHMWEQPGLSRYYLMLALKNEHHPAVRQILDVYSHLKEELAPDESRGYVGDVGDVGDAVGDAFVDYMRYPFANLSTALILYEHPFTKATDVFCLSCRNARINLKFALRDTVCMGHVDIVRFLLRTGVDPRKIDSESSMLLEACSRCHHKTAKVLLERGGDRFRAEEAQSMTIDRLVGSEKQKRRTWKWIESVRLWQ